MGRPLYVAYPTSHHQLEEMMDERGVEVDHSTPNPNFPLSKNTNHYRVAIISTSSLRLLATN